MIFDEKHDNTASFKFHNVAERTPAIGSGTDARYRQRSGYQKVPSRKWTAERKSKRFTHPQRHPKITK
ncbi:hypothetical protein BV898_07711 [Hypsibius exemplaris]|uniref:Uncharacterized protein n=1 Tax=Hypsibius exemplaris TaxID=2072580 RepID=A0A1W0WSF1_HYPEX|nr:hypothetical protein BV898_07711 [Hypsibius exemplaris]